MRTVCCISNCFLVIFHFFVFFCFYSVEFNRWHESLKPLLAICGRMQKIGCLIRHTFDNLINFIMFRKRTFFAYNRFLQKFEIATRFTVTHFLYRLALCVEQNGTRLIIFLSYSQVFRIFHVVN